MLLYFEKRVGFELCSEAALCEDPKLMDKLSEAITALLKQEKQRLQAAFRAWVDAQNSVVGILERYTATRTVR